MVIYHGKQVKHHAKSKQINSRRTRLSLLQTQEVSTKTFFCEGFVIMDNEFLLLNIFRFLGKTKVQHAKGWVLFIRDDSKDAQ